MTAILEKLALYWAYPFVRYALIVGVLIALCSSLLGVTLVLKRFSFIGDGLSHVAFGAMAIAAVLQITNKMPLVMVITILSAVLLLRTQCCQLNNKFLDIDYFRRTCYTFTCLRISNSILYKQHL